MSPPRKATAIKHHHPFDKTWWVCGEQIMGGQYPGTLDLETQRSMLRRLLDYGITHFVNLQVENEAAYGKPFPDYMPLIRPIASELGRELGFRRFPIPDFGIPEPGMMADCLDHIDEVLQNDGKPYVHCWGGNGRTGVVIGCWFVRHGRTPDEAIQEMEQGRLGRGFTKTAPENEKQRQFIMNWPGTDPALKSTSKPTRPS